MKIPIVNEQDEIIEHKESKDRDPKTEIARTSAIWLMNENGEVLISKRAKTKKLHPNLWSSSVTGVNEEGETYESNIIKEVKEELGFDLGKFTTLYKELINDERVFFVQHFLAKIPKDTKFILQDEEVEEVRWISVSDLKDWFTKSPEDFIPVFKYNMNSLKLCI